MNLIFYFLIFFLASYGFDMLDNKAMFIRLKNRVMICLVFAAIVCSVGCGDKYDKHDDTLKTNCYVFSRYNNDGMIKTVQSKYYNTRKEATGFLVNIDKQGLELAFVYCNQF